MNLLEFIQRMPKVELHVHLEGAILPATLLKLARRNNIPLPVQDEVGLREFYRFRDFDHFVEVYNMVTGCLRTPEDYHMIAYEFGRECARQNIRYAEVTFTITSNTRFSGLSWQEILNGLNAGRGQAQAEFGVDWRWVFDILRNAPETQNETLEIAIAARDEGVVALGLGGSEMEFPPQLFVHAFDAAHEAGLPRVPHAGETLGAESIWTALEQLRANRLGHGIRCIEHPLLVDVLRECQIPLEVCPTSNIRLGIFPDYATHPLRILWDKGLHITVNSDDPPMFDCDLNHEYEVLVKTFDFTPDELERVSLNGVQASLLPEDEKASLEAKFRLEFANLRRELK